MIKFTKQIEVRMSKGSSLYNTFVCHDGIDVATIPCEEEWADEVVKRINMHDELVSAMRNMFDMLSINCQCNSYSREQLKKYLEAEKLLERCK